MIKKLKNDTRYIIKRIIIGVGIALIISFLKTNNVFAEEKQDMYVDVFGFNCPINQDTNPYYTTDYSFEIGNYNINLRNNNFEHDNKPLLTYVSMVFSTTAGDYIVYTANSFNPFVVDNVITYFYDLSSLDITSSGFAFYDSNNNITQLAANHEITFSQFFTYTTNSDTNLNFQNIFSDYNSYSNNCVNDTNIYANEFLINGGVPTYSQYFNTLNYLLDNYTLVHTNIPISINGEELSPSPVIPSGYSEINLTGSQGVYFVPKDYSKVNIEHFDNNNYYDFNYYYKGNIKEGWFPLNNINDLFYSSLEFSSDEITLRDSFFPMYQDPNDTALGYNYYAYMIFNNSQEDSSIWYNSEQFNAYVIDDIFNYKNEVCYIDRNDNNICINLDFSINLSEYWLQGFNADNDGFVGQQDTTEGKLNNFFDLLKSPFNFLNSLKNYSCSTITLPIPFLGGNIHLNCLSSTFKNILGDNFYNLIVTILSGFYIYRITIMNINTLTDVLDPKDDKIEVVDL